MTNSKTKTSKQIRLLDRAIHYSELGFRVLPVHTVEEGVCSCNAGKFCKSPGKHPATPNGVKDATSDPEVLSNWFRENNNLNIAIAAGGTSNLIVLDIDPRNGGNESLAKAEKRFGKLPDTAEAATGGSGRHLLFRYPGFDVKKDSHGKRFGSGVDVLSNGAYFVCSPSMHKSGERYRWQKGKGLKSRKILELPDTWKDRLKEPMNKEEVPLQEAHQNHGMIVEGNRNSYLMSRAGVMQRAKIIPSAILAALKEENKTKLEPPLEEAEVVSILESVTKYSNLDDNHVDFVMDNVLARFFQRGQHLLFARDCQFWVFENTHWKTMPIHLLKKRILEVIESSSFSKQGNKASLINNVVELLSAKQASDHDLLRFSDEPLPIINCQNGELWIQRDGSVDLKPHSPKSYQRHVLNVVFDPKAKCPIYNQTLNEIFSNSTMPKALIRHWHELTGYIIQPSRTIPSIVILYGEGSNGKTKVLETISKLLGKGQVMASKIGELEKNRFLVGSLLGKSLLVDDDVQAGTRLQDGELKKLSEAKTLTGENKYGPPFDFVCRAIPFMLCNNLLSLGDISHGMIRRLMIIPFDRCFSEVEIDRTLFPKIWESELSGILNLALNGMKRVKDRGNKFKVPEEVISTSKAWVTSANPVPGFLSECCTIDPQQISLLDSLYKCYVEWCRESGLTFVQQRTTFSRNIELLGYQRATKGSSGVRFQGIGLKSTLSAYS